MKNFVKKNWFKLFFVFILVILSLSFLKYVFDKRENSDFYKNQECQKENSISFYDNRTNKCSVEISKMPKLPNINFCDFEMSESRINQYHFDGPDYKKINELEESCRVGGMFSSWSCTGAENERNSKRKDTYIEIEGLLKSKNDERLRSVVTKIYTQGKNKILLGTGSADFNRDVSKDESIPFKISIYIDRNKELIGNYFNKDDEVDIDTYPWFLSCE